MVGRPQVEEELSDMASVKQIAANRRNAAGSTGPKSAAGKQVARMNALKHGLQAEHVVIPGEDPEEFEALLRGLEEDCLPVGFRESLLVERIAHCTWLLRRSSLIETAMLRKEHFLLEKDHAQDEMKRASQEMDWVRIVLEQGPDEHELEEEEEEEEEEEDSADEHKFPEDRVEFFNKKHDEAEEVYEKARAVYEHAQDELKSSAYSLDVVFLRINNGLERLSRYETTIERRLRAAMQDLERLQAARKAEAAETATVIDITDLNQDEG